MTQKRVLGKGLFALINENNLEGINLNNKQSRNEVDIRNLQIGKFQPRKIFDNNHIEDLAKSIRKSGLISPIIVREIDGQENKYEIIAGERRWRACKLAGLSTVSVIVKKLTDREALEHAIVENIQRKDLNAIEEAESYNRLMLEFNYTQEEVSQVIGKSRSYIANYLRLLSLPYQLKEMINNNDLTAGHARALVNSENPEEFAKEIIKNKLSVRETEKFVKKNSQKNSGGSVRKRKTEAIDTNYDYEKIIVSEQNNIQKDDDILSIENSLTIAIGYNVEINVKDDDKKIIINFDDIADLENILQKFSK